MGEAACEREEVALERDASNRVQNQLLAQLEIPWKAQSTRNHEKEESWAPPSPPRVTDTTRTKSSRRRSSSADPSDDEHSDSVGLHKAKKIPCIEDITELVQKRIEEANQRPRQEMKSCSRRKSSLTASCRNS